MRTLATVRSTIGGTVHLGRSNQGAPAGGTSRAAEHEAGAAKPRVQVQGRFSGSAAMLLNMGSPNHLLGPRSLLRKSPRPKKAAELQLFNEPQRIWPTKDHTHLEFVLIPLFQVAPC